MILQVRNVKEHKYQEKEIEYTKEGEMYFPSTDAGITSIRRNKAAKHGAYDVFAYSMIFTSSYYW
jgi:hypothetical protein